MAGEITYRNVLLLDDNENGLIPYVAPATANSLGIVKVGTGLSITQDGTLSYSLPIATASTLGGIKVGENLSIDNGVLSAQAGDSLPDQTDKAGYLLTTNGTNALWEEATEVYCVIETFQDGTDWYRIWSDGWCEQGGRLTGLSGWQTTVITFLKSFANTNYNITACHTRRTGSAYNDYSATGVINPTKTGMSLNYYGADTTGTIWWQVSGYIEV